MNTNFPSHRLSKNYISVLSQKDRVILLEGPPNGSSYRPRERRKGEMRRGKKKEEREEEREEEKKGR